MTKNYKILTCFIVCSFNMFAILNYASAQTDSSGYRGTEHSYQDQNSNSLMQDSNMIDQNHVVPVQEPNNNNNSNNNNSGSTQNQNNGNNAMKDGAYTRPANRDSMHLQNRSKNMRDSTGTLNRQRLSHQDTSHAIQPAQPVNVVTPVNSTKTVKPAAPVKSADNKNRVKTTKNKTMYLLPDSTLRKDTLK